MKRGKDVWLGVGGLVIRNGTVLVVQKGYGATRGLWTLPGGFVSPGETVDEAVEREVREETGVSARVHGVIAVRTGVLRNGVSDNYLIFAMNAEEGEPRPNPPEILEARYVPVGELSEDSRTADLVKLVLREEEGKSFAFTRQDFRPRRDYGYQRYKIFTRG